MYGLHEPSDNLWLARVLALILADFASVIVKVPTFCNFGSHQFDDNVHWLYALKVVCEVGANAEGRLAEFLCILLYLDGAVGIKCIAENNLFSASCHYLHVSP